MKTKLENLGCFKEVSVFIDTVPDSNGYEVRIAYTHHPKKGLEPKIDPLRNLFEICF